jgi:hypothetical protein
MPTCLICGQEERVVTGLYQSFIVSLNCAIKERDAKKEILLNSLNEEQAALFEQYSRARECVTEIIILD